jgi:hypothetical protein
MEKQHGKQKGLSWMMGMMDGISKHADPCVHVFQDST